MGPDMGNKRWIEVFGRIEDVSVDTMNGIKRALFRKKVNRLLHQCVEPANFIKPVDVIDVVMGHKNAVASAKTSAQRLLSEVGATVDQHLSKVTLGILKSQCS